MGSEPVLALTVTPTPSDLRWLVAIEVTIGGETPAEAATAVLGALRDYL